MILRLKEDQIKYSGGGQESGEETQFIGYDITFYLEKEQETIRDDEAEEEKMRKTRKIMMTRRNLRLRMWDQIKWMTVAK